MEVKKRKSGTGYREKIYINGKSINGPWFRKKSDALVWKRTKLAEKDKMKSMGVNYIQDITLSEYSNIFLLNKATLSKRTQDSYRNTLNKHIIPEFGLTQLKDIKLQNATDFKFKLVNLGLSTTRINNILRLLKVVLNDSVKNEYLMNSPLNNFKLIKNQKRSLNYWLPIEVNKFLRANYESPYYYLYLTALNTGMRKGELCGLLWDAVDFTNNQITVRRTYDRYGLNENTKSNKERVIPMNEPVVKALLTLRSHKRCLKFVFTKPDGSPVDYKHIAHRFFNPAIKRAGVKQIRFHDLRTTFASNYCMNGGDIFALSKILGHSSV